MSLSIITLKTFLQMGGYAAYVWPAYALVIAALGINVLLSRRHFKRIMRQLQDHKHATDA